MTHNQATLIGNLGEDPETRHTTGGSKVVSFSMATSTGSGDKKKTEWHKIVAWAELADIIEKYAHKGDQVFVQGEIRTRKWTDKENIERYTTEIHLGGFNSTFRNLSPRRDGEQRSSSSSSSRAPADDL